MTIYDRNGLIGLNKTLSPINEKTEKLVLNVGNGHDNMVKMNIITDQVVSQHGPRIKVFRTDLDEDDCVDYEVHKNTTDKPIVKLAKHSATNPYYEDAVFGLVQYMYTDIIRYYDREVSNEYIKRRIREYCDLPIRVRKQLTREGKQNYGKQK